jgi:hypothetical protein
MKNKKEFYAMQFEKLGFKKVPTEDGFHMYELTPAAWIQAASHKLQAASHKRQAASNKHLTKLNKGLYRRYESKRSRSI